MVVTPWAQSSLRAEEEQLCQPLSFVRVKGPKGLVVWPVGMVLVRDTGWVCRTALQA